MSPGRNKFRLDTIITIGSGSMLKHYIVVLSRGNKDTAGISIII